MPPELTQMTYAQKYNQYFDPDSTYQKMDSMVKTNGRDHYKKIIDPDSKEPMEPAKVAAIIQRAELGNKRLDVLVSKLDSMPIDQGLSNKDCQTLKRILTDVKSSRPNDQEKQAIDEIVQTIDSQGQDGLTAEQTHQVLAKMDDIRHDRSFFDPEQVKSISQFISNKVTELKAAGGDTSNLEQQQKIMDEIDKLNRVGQEVKQSQSSGMSEVEAKKVVEELKGFNIDDQDDKKDKKQDQKDDRKEDEKSESKQETESEGSDNLESMGEEGAENALEDGVEDGLGDAVVDGVGEVAADAAPEVTSAVVEGAGGLVGAEGAALPEELAGAAGLEIAALPEEAVAAEAVVGAVGAAAI
ncbi:hypothetical protein [Legionella sp. W05-934-2]|uniref:hypothetical protein n=1 Tax=Legionella sp. W05-934-2 TaxID=1198649 RepID=UPI00346332FF